MLPCLCKSDKLIK